MKKICLFKYDYNNVGGTEVVAVKLANELCKYYEVHLVSVATIGNKIEHFKLDSRVKFHNFFTEKKRIRKIFFSASKMLKEYLSKNQIDIIFSIGVQSNALMLLGAQFTKTKTVACDHMTIQNDYSSRSYAFQRWLGAKYADKIVVLTEENLRGYIQKYSISANKITFIYNWIDDLSNEPQYNVSAKQIVTVGRIFKAKGYDLLMPVAKKIFEKHPDWRWYICGDGTEESKEEIRQFIMDNGLEQRLVMLGNVKNMSEVYKNSSIYVMTSYFEGLPLVLLEAKQYKIPIVSFNCSTGPSEIIRNNENGYLIDKFNKNEMIERIDYLITHQNIREEFSKNAYLDIEKFSKSYIIKEWINLIEEMTNNE